MEPVSVLTALGGAVVTGIVSSLFTVAGLKVEISWLKAEILKLENRLQTMEQAKYVCRSH